MLWVFVCFLYGCGTLMLICGIILWLSRGNLRLKQWQRVCRVAGKKTDRDTWLRNILQKNKDHKLWNLYDLWFWLTAQAAFVCCCNYLRYTVDHSNCWQLTGSLQLAAVSCSSFSSQYLCSIYKNIESFLCWRAASFAQTEAPLPLSRLSEALDTITSQFFFLNAGSTSTSGPCYPPSTLHSTEQFTWFIVFDLKFKIPTEFFKNVLRTGSKFRTKTECITFIKMSFLIIYK